MKQRQQITERNRTALMNFENEIGEIGDIHVVNTIPIIRDYRDKPHSVDHNLSRLTGTANNHTNNNSHNYLYDDDNEYEYHTDDDELLDQLNIKNSHKKINEFSQNEEIKEMKEMKTFEEKTILREKLFNHLDNSRIEESELELEYIQSKEQSLNITDYNANKLYLLQKLNYKKFNIIFNELKPSKFTKAWGNDPDFIKLAAQFRQLITKESEPFSSKTIISNDLHIPIEFKRNFSIATMNSSRSTNMNINRMNSSRSNKKK